VVVKVGQTFTCTAVLDGQTVKMDGTVTGNDGRFTVVPDSAIIDVAGATKILTSGITAQTHLHSTVDCGSRKVVVIVVGQTFDCMARLAGEKPRTVKVTAVDHQGNLRYTLGP
jgi:hypothetical protein